MIRLLPVLFALLIVCTPLFADESKRPRRIVCIGDSITEGHTYPFLIQQALREAGKDVPIFINAGVGGDNTRGIITRLQVDVFDFHPDLAILSTAINDMGGDVPLSEFEANYRKIVEAHREQKIPLLLCTATTLAPKHHRAFETLQQYNDVVRKLAKEYGCDLAEVYDSMIQAPADLNLWEDGAHLNFEGYRRMVRPILDAMGNADVPVPLKWKIDPEKGLIRTWQILAYNGEKELTDEEIGKLKPDASWKSYELPEPQDDPSWWGQQQQARGVAWSVGKKLGPAKSFFGYTTIHADAEKKIFLNTGAGLGGIWFNGKRVWNGKGLLLGWRMGGRRVPVTLHAGDNVVIIQSGDKFFLSATEDNDW